MASSNMLSTSSTSSIQERRRLHRRQTSLDVPIIATSLAQNPRRNLRGSNNAHRRGLSLDQSLSAAVRSPSSFGPLRPRDQAHSPALQSLSRPQDTTNTGQPPNEVQHQVQETQLHKPSQPGQQHALDSPSHHQPPPPPPSQQLTSTTADASGNAQAQQPSVPSHPPHAHQPPTLHTPNPQQAAEDLRKHIDWFKKMYGSSPVLNLPTTPTFNAVTQQLDLESQCIMAPPVQFQPPVVRVQTMPQTPGSFNGGHPNTVPNTPQAFATHCWPSPPATNSSKHARSQSLQFDVAPMPLSFETAPLLKFETDPLASLFPQDAYNTTGDQGYASSVYSSSLADASSPTNQHHTPMPTLFEEDSSPMNHMHMHGDLGQDAMLMQATAGASSQDELAYHGFLDMPQPLSPRQAMLDSLNIDASINETGVSAEEVQQFISDQDPVDSKWTCLFDGCNKKFGRKENIRSHVQTHLGDRQFRCNVCKKCFVRQHDLKRHAKIHSGERDCECPCGQSFARADALTRHRQRGVCSGTLPGYERKDGETPKRGRPKKQRPSMDERLDKANRARRFDDANAADSIAGAANPSLMDADAALAAIEAGDSGMSSSSGLSDRSGPITPPDSSDFSSSHATPLDELLSDLDNHHHHPRHPHQQFDFGIWTGAAHENTPPTSPFTGSTSPAKTMPGAGGNGDGVGVLTTVPPSSFTSALHGPATTESISPDALQLHVTAGVSATQPATVGADDSFNPFFESQVEQLDFRDYLNDWLAQGV